LFSEADQANWMLGSIYERTEHSDIAAQYYTRIVRDYPLSPLAANAKTKLTKLNVPVPQADPTAVARMQKEQQAPRARGGILSRPMGMLRTGPDVSMAARVGAPSMTPESDDSTDTLTPGGSLTVGTGGAGAAGSSAYVETVAPGSPGSTPVTSPSTTQPTAAQPVTAAGQSGTDASQAPAQSAQENGMASTGTNGTASQSDASTDSAQSPTSTDPKQESSSKKKKGLKKIIPF
jgi:hypothetical protein